jgi:hypothetical protein
LQKVDPRGLAIETGADIVVTLYDLFFGTWGDVGADVIAMCIPGVPAGLQHLRHLKKGNNKRLSNKLQSHPDAAGPHTTFSRGPDGRIDKYTTFDKNPHTGKFGEAKRFRRTGKPHGDFEAPYINDRKPGNGPGSKPNIPRKPNPGELPRGY